MKSFIVLLALGLASGKVISTGYDTGYEADMGQGGHGDDYGMADYGGHDQGGDYGHGGHDEYASASDYETKCTPYFDNEVHDRCEHYSEKVCYTSQQESCQDVEDKTCRGIVSSRQFRQCFNVTELLCGLKEEIRYDVVQAVFTVQKCHKITERVCDTVYEPQFTNKDDFQCIALRNPQCHAEDRTVVDKTCRTVTNFDCTSAQNGGFGGDMGAGAAAGGYGDAGHDAYGHAGGDYGSAGGYGGDSYGDNGYGEQKCKKTQDTKCYTTPRTVTSQVCEHREDKVCEKLNERVPFPAEKQVCHDEEKKVCELEQRQQPKQIKKYVYTKQCRSVPRRVCENADSKQLVPSCVPTTRKQCQYSPVEKCEDVPKQHCYKVTRRVKKQRCETVPKAGYGGSEPSYSGSAGGDNYGTDAYAAGGVEYSR